VVVVGVLPLVEVLGLRLLVWNLGAVAVDVERRTVVVLFLVVHHLVVLVRVVVLCLVVDDGLVII